MFINFLFYAIFFCYLLTSTSTHVGATLVVEAKCLALEVGLLISRISGRSKQTIKGGVCGNKGSLASQHMDTAMEKRVAEGVSLRWTAVHTPGHMQSD